MCSPRIADCCASTKCGKREVTVIPSVSSNQLYIGRDRAFSRVFAEYLLGFEGTPCVILSGVLKQHQTIKFACRCRYARSDRMLISLVLGIGSAAHSVWERPRICPRRTKPRRSRPAMNVHLLGPISVLGRPQLLAQFSEFSDVGFGSVWVSRPRRLGASWLGFR